jgi:putative ABC transport system permease protein
MINEEFRRKFFPHEDPIGRRVKIGATEDGRESYGTRMVVGVIDNFRRSNVAQAPEAAFFVPLSQLMWGTPTLVVRTAADPNQITPQIRKLLASMDPNAPLYEVRTLKDYFVLDLGRARFQTMLLGLFASLALLLTAVGLYGVMAYAVVQRTQEIGIRVALGAGRGDVLRMILAKSFLITGIGLLLGMAGAATLTRLFASLLYEVKPADPMTFAIVSLLLVGTSTLASYIPARRAAKVDPMVALRYE